MTIGAPCDPKMAEPIVIKATFRRALEISYPIALDGILAATEARIANLPPLLRGADPTPIEVPILREPGGRFHLCSASVGQCDQSELAHRAKRPVVEQAQAMGVARRVNIATGRDKAMYRPRELRHYAELTWFAIGDRERIEALLSLVRYVGGDRGTGRGEVSRWSVEEFQPWDGFPVLRDGLPLRALPVDWPGLDLDSCMTEQARLTYPYWMRDDLVEAAVPELE